MDILGRGTPAEVGRALPKAPLVVVDKVDKVDTGPTDLGLDMVEGSLDSSGSFKVHPLFGLSGPLRLTFPQTTQVRTGSPQEETGPDCTKRAAPAANK